MLGNLLDWLKAPEDTGLRRAFGVDVVSVAVLADTRESFRPTTSPHGY
ncbi:hypothetical protein KG088_04615 [Halomonas sp. TRM85114]|nr:hypothetical protein [Halomonas jincaotanensis]MBS9402904.1 hypothetical protein [Halomonas jincaotanensis]